MMELKKCPYCGSEYVLLRHEFSVYYVRCIHCGLFSKFAKTPDEAIKIWNKRFRPPYCSECKEFDRCF